MERSNTELLFVCLKDVMVNTFDNTHSIILKALFSVARTLKASTSFPVLKLDQESSKLRGVRELAV